MLETALPREAPFMIEPVEAWRAWLVDLSRPHRGPILRSITYRAIWPPRRTMHAHCLSQFRASLKGEPSPVARHECPNANHRCGIYAVKREEDLATWTTAAVHVAGRVKLWGRVYLYERGYIAEYAYPAVLTYRRNPDEVNDEVIAMLADSYGIEVEL